MSDVSKRIMHLAERFSEEVPETPTDTPDAGRASSHFGSVAVPSDSVLANGKNSMESGMLGDYDYFILSL